MPPLPPSSPLSPSAATRPSWPRCWHLAWARRLLLASAQGRPAHPRFCAVFLWQKLSPEESEEVEVEGEGEEEAEKEEGAEEAPN